MYRYVTADEIVTLNGPARDPTGPIAVLGPGTGLGEAMLFYNNQAAEVRLYKLNPAAPPIA